MTSYAEYRFVTASPPRGEAGARAGTLAAVPPAGTALVTTFTLSTSGWVDPNGSADESTDGLADGGSLEPLHYAFYATPVGAAQSTAPLLLGAFAPRRQVPVTLPPGIPDFDYLGKSPRLAFSIPTTPPSHTLVVTICASTMLCLRSKGVCQQQHSVGTVSCCVNPASHHAALASCACCDA